MKRFLRAGKIKYYENGVFKEKIKIEKETIWTKLKKHSTKIYGKILIPDAKRLCVLNVSSYKIFY